MSLKAPDMLQCAQLDKINELLNSLLKSGYGKLIIRVRDGAIVLVEKTEQVKMD